LMTACGNIAGTTFPGPFQHGQGGRRLVSTRRAAPGGATVPSNPPQPPAAHQHPHPRRHQSHQPHAHQQHINRLELGP
ncbi:MAG: hypothetical protein ACK56I_18685, partial [bacterium]